MKDILKNLPEKAKQKNAENKKYLRKLKKTTTEKPGYHNAIAARGGI